MNPCLIIIVLSILQYTLDPTIYICPTIRSKTILFLHHIISIYVTFGAFLMNPLHHIIFCLTLLFHWTYNGNRCELTLITNRECGIDESYVFKDYLQTSGISSIFPNVHWYLLPTLILIDLYRIYK